MKLRTMILLGGMMLASSVCEAQNYMILRSKNVSTYSRWEPIRVDRVDHMRFDQGGSVNIESVKMLSDTSVKVTVSTELTDTLKGELIINIYGNLPIEGKSDRRESTPEQTSGKDVCTYTFENLYPNVEYNVYAYIRVNCDNTFGAYIDAESAKFETGNADAACAQNIVENMMLEWYKAKDFVGYERHNDFGMPSLMHALDVMTEDIAVPSSSFNWFANWSANQLGYNSYSPYIHWATYLDGVRRVNGVINWLKPMADDATVKPYVGMAYAMRAHINLTMAQMYEFLDNDKTSNINDEGNDVRGLTMPILTDDPTKNDSARVSKSRMVEFIKNDLDKALSMLEGYNRTDKTQFDANVIAGLQARLAMWNGDYAAAAQYARKVINSGATPMSRNEWLDPLTGFNNLNPSAWIWGLQYNDNDAAMQSGLINWTSWMSPEYTDGYSYYGPQSMIDQRLYNRIADSDFRKLAWKAPRNSALAENNSYAYPEQAEYILELAGIKFRPMPGENPCCVAVPLMRVEEMILIEAEALAHTGQVAEGVERINQFMKQYRDANYQFTASTAEELIEEVFLQKRIELWGEGLVFFDYKRLNKSVDRAYSATNHAQEERFQTNGRPAWMNMVFPASAYRTFPLLENWNNPNPTDLYEPVR